MGTTARALAKRLDIPVQGIVPPLVAKGNCELNRALE
jgi:hypothetical protein